MHQSMTIDIHDIETRLWELLPLVNSGSEVIVTQAKEPILRLMPINPEKQERIPGLHAGMGWISDDFDEPLSDEFWAGSQ